MTFFFLGRAVGIRSPAFASVKIGGFGIVNEIKKSSEAIFLYDERTSATK